MSWNSLVAALGGDLELWLKFEDSTTGGTGTDSSGNGHSVVYPNGTYAPGGYIYPKRGEAALVSGTTDSILTGGGGNAECHVASPFCANFLTAGSWTFGGAIKTSSTTAATQQWGSDGNKAGTSLNYDFVNASNSSGAISLFFDSTETNANGLTVTSTGFNDGNVHLLLFEYDATGDTLSIWLDGTEIGTRSRAGTKPTSGNLSGNNFQVAPVAGFSGLRIDEFIAVSRVLTGTEHSDLWAAVTSSAVAKSDTDTFTLSESEALTTLTAKADTDSLTFTEGAESISGLISKADTDSFTFTDTAALTYRTSLVATDLFRATDRDFLNYSPTPPLNVKFSGHRVYAQLADADNLPAVPSPSRTFRMPTTTEDLDLYLLDENLTIIDPADLTMTFDVGTPGVRVEGVDGDITAEPSGSGDPLVWITVPGGLLPGVYSCRLTVNTGTVEDPVYRSYPTEPITLIVED